MGRLIRIILPRVIVAILFSWACAASAAGAPYYFSLLAGSLSTGTNDGPGALARFNMPRGVAVSRDGRILVADTLNHTIRLLSGSGTNWLVTTIAGTPGISGTNDGLNATALFHHPWGIAVDAATNVYVTDGNHTVRRLRQEGTGWRAVTIAGRAGVAGLVDGTGSGARFNAPAGVAIDLAGIVYVADSLNRRLRTIDAAGVVTTIGPEYEKPVEGLGADVSGVLYVSEPANHTIWKLHPGGYHEKYAGNAEAGSVDGFRVGARFRSPAGVAADSLGVVFVADAGNHLVRRIDLAGYTSTMAGASQIPGDADGVGEAARFNNPSGIAIGPVGEIVLADSRNSTIRLLNARGLLAEVDTIAGASGVGSQDGAAARAEFFGPTHVAVGLTNEIYVSDTGNHTIRRIVHLASGTTVSTVAGSPGQGGFADGSGSAARFRAPAGLAVSTNGQLFLTDRSNHLVRLIVWTNGAIRVSTIAGMVTNAGNANGTGQQARFDMPGACTLDGAGALYVSDTGNSRIRRLVRSGNQWSVTTIAGSTPGFSDGANTAARFREPVGIAADVAGSLYVADTENHVIRRVSRTGNNWLTTTIAGSPGQPGTVNGTNNSAKFTRPFGIAVDSSGRVYVGEPDVALIRFLEPSGTNWLVSTLAGMPRANASLPGLGTEARFMAPAGMAVGGDGRLYVADALADAVSIGEPLPTLRITQRPAGAVITWEPWAFRYLLETSSFATTNLWRDVTNSSNPFAFPAQSAGSSGFFRLRRLPD